MADYVDVPLQLSAPRASTSRTGLCEGCNKELPDKRSKWCADCRPAGATATTLKSGRPRSKKTTKITDATARGMNSITAKLLWMLTLAWAWSQLRRMGIPDYSGDISDRLAFSETEADVIAKPLSRLFLKTEGGRKLAPTLVDNEDTIDALFAVWDWYKRTTETLDEYRQGTVQQTPQPQPMRQRTATSERGNGNGNAGQTGETTGASDGGEPAPTYIPPSAIDLASAGYDF